MNSGILKTCATASATACLMLIGFKYFGQALGVSLAKGGLADQAIMPFAIIGALLVGFANHIERNSRIREAANA